MRLMSGKENDQVIDIQGNQKLQNKKKKIEKKNLNKKNLNVTIWSI